MEGQHSLLDTLPAELVAHVAISSDAISALNLSRTCRHIRAACYDILVFRTILENAQTYSWKRLCLDMDAIVNRCGRDVSAWARYAVADHKAWELAQPDESLSAEYRHFGLLNACWHWLPQLLILKHPFVYDKCWRLEDTALESLSTAQMLCLALGLLASEDPTPEYDEGWDDLPQLNPESNAGCDTYLWSLCRLIMDVKMHRRNQTYQSRTITYIDLPSLDQINMAALQTPNLSIPLPFSGHEPDDWHNDAIHKWFVNYGAEYLKTRDISQQIWQGYYTMPRQIPHLEPPVKNVKFTVRRGADLGQDEIELKAKDCKDGVGLCDIEGILKPSEDGDGILAFEGNKIYRADHHGRSWQWEYSLQLTPLGFIGHWSGTWGVEGYVWLWKA